MLRQLLLLFASVHFPLATFADACSIIGWLLHHAPLLLLFASITACLPLSPFTIPYSVVSWLLHCMLLFLLFAPRHLPSPQLMWLSG
jgi:hypothetical protein